MTVDYPWLLGLALLLPAVIAVALVRADRRRRVRLARFGDLDVVSRLMPAGLARATGWRTARLASACALCGVALAGPRWGYERAVNRTRGFDMVLALDASLSMRATDVKPDRLERMKEEVRRVRAMSSGDRIGLIVFAGRSYVLSPLTVDESALDLFLDSLDPSIVGQGGSSLSSAIRQGTDLLSLSNDGADRALVVMSDGEAFEPEADVVAAARRAGDKGIALVTVGFGTTQGSTIPVRAADGTVSLKRDQQGAIVVTHYVPAMLQAAATAAHGTFIDASVTDKAVRIRQALSSLRTARHATLGGDARVPRFQWFLLPAVLLLLLDVFVTDRRRRVAVHRVATGATATAAMLVLATFLGSCAGTQESRDAARAYEAGQYPEAVKLYRNAIAHGDQRPQTIYDYGTAYLATDSVESAVEAFERVIDLPDVELRYRALFNLGLAHLRRGLKATTGGGDDLDAALAAYKKVLLMRSGDVDAKWNYELALHAKQAGGGGGGGGGQNNNSQSPSPQPQSPEPRGGLGLNQARQLLASAAREERDVQAKQQHKTSAQTPPNGKDW